MEVFMTIFLLAVVVPGLNLMCALLDNEERNRRIRAQKAKMEAQNGQK